MPNAQPYSETCLDVDNVVWSGNLEEIDADCICLQIVQGPGDIRSSDSGVDLDDVILMLSVCCLLFLSLRFTPFQAGKIAFVLRTVCEPS